MKFIKEKEEKPEPVEKEKNEEEKTEIDWVPKTEVGKKVFSGEIKSLDEFFDKGYLIKEPEIVDALVPELKVNVVEVTKTTTVTMAGRNFGFRATVVVGDGESYIGIGSGKSKERFQAIKKAEREAKKNLVKVRRGCGSWECSCTEGHSIPFSVVGREGSVKVKLIPAPKGTGLVIGEKVKPIFEFVGIKDVWSKSFGATHTVHNFAKAVVDALSKTTKIRFTKDIERKIKR